MGFDEKIVERIDVLYRSSQTMRWLCIWGAFIPIVLLPGAAIGALHGLWYRRLFNQLGADYFSIEPSSKEDSALRKKLAQIRKSSWAFFTPSIELAIYFLLVAIVVFFVSNSR